MRKKFTVKIVRALGSSLKISLDKRKARDIAIAVALTLSNQFHIDSRSRVECLHCVVDTVLMLYHVPCNRAVSAAVTFIRYR